MRTPLLQDLQNHIVGIIRLARPLVEAIARRDRDLAVQVKRALNSVALNTAEAFGNAAGNARLRFESACGSLYEARAGLGAGVAWGYVSAASTEPALAAIDSLAGRLFGLAHR